MVAKNAHLGQLPMRCLPPDACPPTPRYHRHHPGRGERRRLGKRGEEEELSLSRQLCAAFIPSVPWAVRCVPPRWHSTLLVTGVVAFGRGVKRRAAHRASACAAARLPASFTPAATCQTTATCPPPSPHLPVVNHCGWRGLHATPAHPTPHTPAPPQRRAPTPPSPARGSLLLH